MRKIFSIKPVMHLVAAGMLAIVSFTAAAQSAPTAGICERDLSPFQKQLYDHFRAGPDALRDFIFNVRGVRLLDIYEVDAWARKVSADACPERGENVAATGATEVKP